VVPIPEAQVGNMKIGQLVSFTVPAYPGQSFKAPVQRVSREVDEKSRTMPVEPDVQNLDGRLSPGSFTTRLMAARTGLSNSVCSFVGCHQRSTARRSG
jgi:multidrug efflux pump subunit AcrA (membrane-fusion protein)